METGELRFANDLAGRELLAEEMAGMKRSSLSGKRDDAVMALALACWKAGRGKVGESGERLLMH